MADYQKVEVSKDSESGPLSDEDISGLQEEAAQQEAAQQARFEEEEQREQVLADDDRPEWLPEKFKSAEDLASAYSDLESEYTKFKQDNGGESEESDTPHKELSLNDFSQFTEEFADTGDVSEENRKTIEDWGIPREMIDGYIEGQKAVLEQNFNSVYSVVGGEENYESMIEWARNSIPEGEQEVFNDSVVNGNPHQMMFAVQSMASRWQQAGGTGTKPLLQGDTGSMGASGGFRSLAELTNAMKDPRYSKDPAYRKDIETRLGNSNIL